MRGGVLRLLPHRVRNLLLYFLRRVGFFNSSCAALSTAAVFSLPPQFDFFQTHLRLTLFCLWRRVAVKVLPFFSTVLIADLKRLALSCPAAEPRSLSVCFASASRLALSVDNGIVV